MSRLAIGLILCSASAAIAAPRDIQFRSVDLDSGVIELHNFGTTTEDLSGWRFCSHDAAVVRRYSSTTGLNGRSLGPGDSLFVHFANDASASDEINVSAIGGAFASPNTTAYAIQIYFSPVSFGNGNTMADIVQWTQDGTANLIADERTDEAITGGLWGQLDDFIGLNGGTYLRLMDLAGGEFNESADYAVVTKPDCNNNGRDDVFEVLDGALDPCAGGGGGGCDPDLNNDGNVGGADLAILLAAWGPCP